MVRARQNLAVSQRYYDPVIGRYISRDPIGYGDGPNVYLYTHNNPINGIDPLGLEAEPQWHHRVGKTPFADNVVDHPELWKDGKVGKIEKTKKEGYRVAQGELLIDANDKKYGTMLHPDDHSQLAAAQQRVCGLELVVDVLQVLDHFLPLHNRVGKGQIVGIRARVGLGVTCRLLKT